MLELWAALGYDEIAAEIARSLDAGPQINVVQGPPGAGKSWLAKGIGAMWQDGGGSTIVAEGDVLRSDVALYPLGFALAGLSSGWRSMGAGVAAATRAGERMVGTAGLLTATVQALATLQPKRRRARKLFLGDAEQEILYELERLGKRRPILLIADNLHWWDVRSLELVSRMREPRMREAFPFLAEMRIVAVRTPEPHQRVANREAHDRFLASDETRTFTLQRVPRERFQAVLAALGARPAPSPEVSDTIHALSGGHLALASRCARRLAEGETASFLSLTGPEEFLSKLLSERVRSLGSFDEEVLRLLQVAAALGETFRRDEVTCAAGVDERATARLLRHCRDEAVLELVDDVGRFAHDIYRQYFLTTDVHDRPGVHEQLSRCLRLLRPAEYDLRCVNAVNAERTREAAALGVHAALQTLREGRPWEALPATILDAIDRGGLRTAMVRLAEAFEHVNAYRFAACLQALDSLPRDLPKSVVAEADHLRAMCLMSTRSEQDRARGRAILEPWKGYEREEPELGVRLMQLLLYGLAHVPDKEPGLTLERDIQHALIERTAFDGAATDALYVLDRCAGALNSVDVSVVRNREAARHFGPRDDGLVRRPVEYYRCLVNLCASLVSNARYEEACEVYGDLERLVSAYSPDVFPRLYFAQMNGMLAEYRLGRLSPADAVARLEAAAPSPSVVNDPFYFQNAQAVFLALGGAPERGCALLTEIQAQLAASRTAPEPSMTYLIGANRAVTRYLLGAVEEARADWAALAGVVTRIAYPSRDVYVRRHELMAELLEEGPVLTPAELDVAVPTRHPHELGPLWRDYGHGFMLPAIELWRDN